MRNNLCWILSTLLMGLIGCGGSDTPTAVPPAVIPTDAQQADTNLPPTFTPEAVAFEQPTPITPVPHPTSAPTAVPSNSQPNARQLLIAAENNLTNLSSFSHERSINVNTPAFNQTEDISCVFSRPDQAFCHAYRQTVPITGDARVRDFEFVQRGQQLWARRSSQSEWEEQSPDNTNYVEAYTNQLLLSPYVTDAFIFGEADIDAVPVYEIRLTLEPLLAVEALYRGESFADFLAQAQEGQATATVWIGREDRQLRLLTIDIRFMTTLGEVSLNGLGTVANFNETAAIPQP